MLRHPLSSPLQAAVQPPFALRRASSAGFSPSSLYPAAGLWAEPDQATAYQDSAATTAVTASGQPVGKRLDKSGNALHLLQATSTLRPIYTLASGIQYDLADGVDDGYGTAGFAAATFTSNMDFFMAINRASSSQVVLVCESSGGKYFGAMSGTAGAAAASSGAPTFYVDGVAVPGGTGTTQSQLSTAATAGAWHIVEMRNLDLSTWTALLISQYAGWTLSGSIGPIVLCPAQTDTTRASIRQYLAGKVGATVV